MATKPTPATDPAEEIELGEDTPEPSPDELKAQLREAQQESKANAALAKEREETIAYWKRRDEREANRPQTPTAAPKVADPDPLEELDLLTLLTEEKDPVKIRKELAKAVDSKVKRELKSGNFVSKAEMETYIGTLITGASQINKLVQEFPQLSDPKSEFFSETQRQLGVLSEDPAYQGTPDGVLQRMAAQQAELTMIKAGKVSAETDERSERIANQRGGSRGRGQVSSDVSLSLAEKDMARKLGVSEKDYLAQKRALAAPGALGPAMTADRLAREFNG